MSDTAAIKAVVRGIVQGVFFRDFVAGHARGLGVGGYVRNLPDGTLEMVAEGRRDSLDKLIEHLRTGPPRAVVEKVDIKWLEYTGRYADFAIKY